jgi:hypothetical protein
MNQDDKRKWTYILLIVGCLSVSLFCLAYPIYVIRPFRYQGARELAAALAIMRFRPFAMGLCVGASLMALTLYWRVQTRVWRRILPTLGVIGVCLFAVLSRVNIYELMFHPMGNPDFVPAAETKLDGDEKVLAIEIAGSARAYPIRSISYHHVVNDVLGAVPIVATY